MTKEKFYHGLTEISDKYIKEADIFGPVKPEKVSPVSTVLRWSCAAAACLVVGIGVWLLGKNGLLPIASVQSQPGGTSSLSSAVNGAEVLSENTVTMNRDGSLTFANQELQEMYEVFTEHDPVTTDPEEVRKLLENTEGDPVNRVLTLTFPCYIVERYPVEERTHILSYLYQMSYSFRKAEDETAYLRPEFSTAASDSQSAGVIGYYEKEGAAVPYGSGGAFHAEQCLYFHSYDPNENDLYWDTLHAFINGTEIPEYSTGTVEADAIEADRKNMELFESWTKGSEDLIYKLLYSYLEQNDLLEYARVQLPGSKEMVELSGGDSIADAKSQQSDVPLLSSDALYISKEGELTFADREYQEYYNTFRDSFGAYIDPASAAGEDTCTALLRLPLPYYELGRYSAEDGTIHVLLLLESTDYGLFETNGVKTVKPINEYSDVAGVVAVPQNNQIVPFWGKEVWYPRDGKDYLPSIARFTGLTEEETSALLEKAEQKRTAFNKDGEQAGGISQQLLFAYMSQNDLTGYQLQDGEYRPITDKELHAAAMRNETAKQNVSLRQEQKAAQDGANTANDNLASAQPGDSSSSSKAPNIYAVDSTGHWVDTTSGTPKFEVSFQEEVQREAARLAYDYVRQCFDTPDHPLAECTYQNLRVVAVSEEQGYFRMAMQLVFKPQIENDSYWLAGNTKEGTGENAGFFTASREIEVQKSGISWSITNSGTGGFTNEGGVEAVDWTIE